jgi:ATP-dependent DNA helicase 2 subunit 2
MSGLDIDALLGSEKRVKISAENAVPEFKQLLSSSEDLTAVQDVVKQMAEIISSQIKNSFGDSGYERAIEGLNVMRKELMENENPRLWNGFIKDLKKKLLAGELGGERKDMWWEIRMNRLGLVDHKASEASDITEEEAKNVSFLCINWKW